MVVHPYNDQFAKMRRTSMTLLKDLGYGRKFVEARIGIELEDLVEKIRELNGRSFDLRDLMYQCNNGIMMSFMFGRQFDYDNDPLMQHVNKFIAMGIEALNPELELFPILSYMPKYGASINRVFESQK
jgi:hypothetical protein